MNKKLKLYFKDEANGSKTITIDYPNEGYEKDEVEIAMASMISAGVIQTKNGNIAQATKAELETVDREVIVGKEA